MNTGAEEMKGSATTLTLSSEAGASFAGAGAGDEWQAHSMNAIASASLIIEVR